ncbi:MAG: 2TM domain-containing protein [Spirochaetia bacterium]
MIKNLMEHKEYRLAAIMYTDIVGFSKMMETNEAETLKLMAYHNELVTSLAQKYNGTVIKTVGDAFLVDFNNTVNAVRCGIEIQNRLADSSSSEFVLNLRIGVHLGDIYFFDNDALGEGINIASRLQSLASPGSICISEDVYNLIANKIDNPIRKKGKTKLKNISREINAYEILTDSSKKDSAAGTAKSEDIEDDEYQDLKRAVLAETKRSGRRLSIPEVKSRLGLQSSAADEILYRLSEKGFLKKQNDPAPRPKMRDTSDRLPQKTREDIYQDQEWEFFLEDYRDHIVKKAKLGRKSFMAHFSSWAGVNGFLAVLYLLTPGWFPWFLFPALAWGIGLANHYASVRRTEEQAAEVSENPQMGKKQLKLLRKLNKLKDSFSGHLISTGAVSLFLFCVNMITTPGVPWFIFPAGAMSIGLLARFPSYNSGERGMTAQLEQEGVRVRRGLFGGSLFKRKRQNFPEIPSRESVAGTPAYGESLRLKAAIVNQLNTMNKETIPFDEDIVPQLDEYVNQIKFLEEKNQEIEKIINTIPMGELGRDLINLKQKIDSVENEKVREEYRQSIQQIEKQQRSFSELKDEQDIIRLRINKGVNLLKQMQIDLARMQNVSSDEHPAVFSLREKTAELSHYLEDFRSGYEELDT